MNPSNPFAVDRRSLPERTVVASAANAFALMLLFAPASKVTASEQSVSQSQQKVAADQKKLLKSAADSSIYPKPENMLVNTDPEPDLNSGFVSLYNGKNLDGWVQRGAKNKYEAKGDVIEGEHTFRPTRIPTSAPCATTTRILFSPPNSSGCGMETPGFNSVLV